MEGGGGRNYSPRVFLSLRTSLVRGVPCILFMHKHDSTSSGKGITLSCNMFRILLSAGKC